MATVQNLGELVDSLQASGEYTFTRKQALGILKTSGGAFKKAAARLVAKRRLAMPRRGFFVIVPIEYRVAGSPPPDWFVDGLMKYMGQPYYVGLLSAAAIYGAAHQQPQELQVVTSVPSRPARAGRARLRFFMKKDIAETPVSEVKTDTGMMKISSAEATALDLVRYLQAAGGLDSVAAVLSDLRERLSPEGLVQAARAGLSLSCAQRAGFLLDLTGPEDLTVPLQRWVASKGPRMVPLRPGRRCAKCRVDQRWKIVINAQIEVEQ